MCIPIFLITKRFESLRNLKETLLSDGFSMECFEDYDVALEHLSIFTPRVALVDVSSQVGAAHFIREARRKVPALKILLLGKIDCVLSFWHRWDADVLEPKPPDFVKLREAMRCACT